MSVKAMTWAWAQDCAPATKAVLLALADHADDDGICWPGRKGLAQKLGIVDRNVTRHIAHLVHTGLLKSEARHQADGTQTTNFYTLMGVATPHDNSIIHPMIKVSPPLDENVQGRGAISSSPRPQPPYPPSPSQEPSLEPSVLLRTKSTQKKTPAIFGRREKSKTSYPPFFEPLTTLPGFKSTAHDKAIATIRATCEAAHVDPLGVVSEFASYYNSFRFKHGWSDPVATLVRTLEVQIGKAVRANGTLGGHSSKANLAASTTAAADNARRRDVWSVQRARLEGADPSRAGVTASVEAPKVALTGNEAL